MAQAEMGYVGYLRLGGFTNSSVIGANNYIIRATSCDVKTSQDITYPPLVDGRADQTVYQMGPKVTGGNAAFPLVHDIPNATEGQCQAMNISNIQSNSFMKALFLTAASRDATGRPPQFSTYVRYSISTAYQYYNCMVESLQMTVNQSAAIECSMEIFGSSNQSGTTSAVTDRTPITGDTLSQIAFLSPARVATWNDAIIQLYNLPGNAGYTSSDILYSNQIREYTISIKNNLERFYTLSGNLSAWDIAAGKREISGTLKLLGTMAALSNNAYNNDQRYSSQTEMIFSVGLGGTPYCNVLLSSCVFSILEMSLSTGVFETSTKWRALGSCSADTGNFTYDAITINSSAVPSTAWVGSPSGTQTLSVPVYTSSNTPIY